jgi:hypothetical protein
MSENVACRFYDSRCAILQNFVAERWFECATAGQSAIAAGVISQIERKPVTEHMQAFYNHCESKSIKISRPTPVLCSSGLHEKKSLRRARVDPTFDRRNGSSCGKKCWTAYSMYIMDSAIILHFGCVFKEKNNFKD